MKTFSRIILLLLAWGLALFAALKLNDAPVDWGHVCGPWGCGPPLKALVGRGGSTTTVSCQAIRPICLFSVDGPDKVPIHRKEVYHEPAPSPIGDSFLHEV